MSLKISESIARPKFLHILLGIATLCDTLQLFISSVDRFFKDVMQSARKSGEDGNTDDFLGYIEIPIKVQISPIQTIFIITILTIFMYN